MATQLWSIDETHSGIHFSVRHLVIARVRGAFNRWTGELTFDEQDPTRSSVAVNIDVASIDTKNPQRDDHLRSPDFFDAARFPAMTFRSKHVETTDDGALQVIGDLTIRDVTREVALLTEFAGVTNDPWGGRRAGFAAKVTIDRREFGLTWNQLLEAGGVAVGDKVEIGIEIEAVAQAAAVKGAAA